VVGRHVYLGAMSSSVWCKLQVSMPTVHCVLRQTAAAGVFGFWCEPMVHGCKRGRERAAGGARKKRRPASQVGW
jgi:hypothetical protein